MSTDDDFLAPVADRLAALPGVRAVALGGSRAQGTARPDSDWDLAVYYRGTFDPQDLRDVGWSGHVGDLGSWGGGVFNGGAWLEIDGRRVDVHYRDLDVVEREIAAAEAGRVRVEPLLFHLVGFPTYAIVAELALNETLRGELPRPAYPPALRANAPGFWWDGAALEFGYVLDQHVPYHRVTPALGLLATATVRTAHAVLAARAEWVTNEKRLVERAGLDPVDALLARSVESSGALRDVAERVRALCTAAVDAADPLRPPGAK